jgi:hypothetical protein
MMLTLVMILIAAADHLYYSLFSRISLLISIKFLVCQLPLFESLPLSEDSSSESIVLGGHMLEVLKEGSW